jgi:hypothetical protein
MTCWDLLINGSLIQSAYCAYDTPWTIAGQNHYVFGILFILFMALLFIQNRNIAFNFSVTLILFILTFVFIPPIIRGVIVTILLFELVGILWDVFFNENQ